MAEDMSGLVRWTALDFAGGGEYRPSATEKLLVEMVGAAYDAYVEFSHRDDKYALRLSREVAAAPNKVVIYQKLLLVGKVSDLPDELRAGPNAINMDRLSDVLSAIDGKTMLGLERIGVCNRYDGVEPGSEEAIRHYLDSEAVDMASIKFKGGRLEDYKGKPGVFDFRNRTPQLPLGLNIRKVLERVLPYLRGDSDQEEKPETQ